MPPPRLREAVGPAFTLIELLVSVSIVAVLAALLFAGMGKVREVGDRTVALQNMRTIGTAIFGYSSDHDSLLPGPLWPGQMPMFDPNREGRLVREVAAYLPIAVPTAPKLEPLFVPPAYRRVVGDAALAVARTFVLNMAVPTASGVLNPWGSLAAAPGSSPARLSVVPSRAWGFSDADRRHPRVAGAGWANQTPPFPIHTPVRLAWFFDGSAGPIERDALN